MFCARFVSEAGRESWVLGPAMRHKELQALTRRKKGCGEGRDKSCCVASNKHRVWYSDSMFPESGVGALMMLVGKVDFWWRKSIQNTSLTIEMSIATESAAKYWS
jgi:hypothetical protein